MRFWIHATLPFAFAGCFIGGQIQQTEFSHGEYQLIHGEPYICIQPDMTTPWKERCKHTRTGEVIEVEKTQISTQ